MAAPTGAPGQEHEPPAEREARRPTAGGPADPEDARRWAAEAERLRSERPPHWG